MIWRFFMKAPKITLNSSDPFEFRTYTVNGSKKIYSKWSGKKSVKL